MNYETGMTLFFLGVCGGIIFLIPVLIWSIRWRLLNIVLELTGWKARLTLYRNKERRVGKGSKGSKEKKTGKEAKDTDVPDMRMQRTEALFEAESAGKSNSAAEETAALMPCEDTEYMACEETKALVYEETEANVQDETEVMRDEETELLMVCEDNSTPPRGSRLKGNRLPPMQILEEILLPASEGILQSGVKKSQILMRMLVFLFGICLTSVLLTGRTVYAARSETPVVTVSWLGTDGALTGDPDGRSFEGLTLVLAVSDDDFDPAAGFSWNVSARDRNGNTVPVSLPDLRSAASWSYRQSLWECRIVFSKDAFYTVNWNRIEDLGGHSAALPKSVRFSIDHEPPSCGGLLLNGSSAGTGISSNSPVTVSLPVSDSVSGIRSVAFYYTRSGSADASAVSDTVQLQNFSGASAAMGQVVYSPAAGQWEGSIYAIVTDMAGHSIQVPSQGGVHLTIDSQAPKLYEAAWSEAGKRVYETTDNVYYAEEAEILLSVQESHFSSDNMEILVNDSRISARWEYEGGLWKSRISLTEEGEYRLKLRGADSLGNIMPERELGTAVLDFTEPEAALSIRKISEENEISVDADPGFYSSGISVEIQVSENFFSPNLVQLELRKDGEIRSVEPVWENNEDNSEGMRSQSAVLLLEEQGNYEISIEGEDLAGNRMGRLSSGVLTLDFHSPSIQISGAEDGKLYGSTPDLHITLSDAEENLDLSTCAMELEGWLWKNSTVERNTFPVSVDRDSFFVSIPGEDGFYRLKILARDHSGNVKEEQISFSVWKEGARILFSEENAVQLKKFWSFELEEDLYYRIYGLSPEMDYSLRINGKTVSPDLFSAEIETQENGWTICSLHVPKELFCEEGEYQISLTVSDFFERDRFSDLEQIQKNMVFVIDQTPPLLRLEGIQENSGGEKILNSDLLIIYPRDDGGKISSLSVFFETEEVLHLQGDELEDALAQNGRVECSFENWEAGVIRISCTDEAGNSNEERITIADQSHADSAEDDPEKNMTGAVVGMLTAGILASLFVYLSRKGCVEILFNKLTHV